MEVNKMEKDNKQNIEHNNEEIMNRVNQTFDKISQDVKNMINNNDSSDNEQYS